MSNVTRLPPFATTVHVEADIPVSQRDEFDRAMMEIVAGERPRMDALARDEASIHARAIRALQAIEAAINAHPTTGQSRLTCTFPGRRLQRFGLSIQSRGTPRPGHDARERVLGLSQL
jgi:hypothetical protein